MRPSARRGARRALPLALPVVLGLPVGLAWWLLAPTAPVGALATGTLVAPSAPELAAGQDGVLVLLGVAAGLLCGLVAVVRSGPSPSARSLAVLAGCVLGSLLAWAVGMLLGPDPVAEQLAARAATDPDRPPVSPLTVHTWAVLLVWPVVAALVATAGHLGAAWAARPPASPDDDAWAAGGISSPPGR